MSAPTGTRLGRRMAVNALHAISGRVAAVLVWLWLTPAILRGLGAEIYGLWALFFALTGQLASFDFGLVQGTLRHVAAARERGDHEAAGSFTTLALLGYLALGVAWLGILTVFMQPILAWLHIPDQYLASARWAMWMGPAVFVLCGFASVMMAVAQACGRFDLANLITLAPTGVLAVTAVPVLRSGAGLQGLVIIVMTGWALAALLGLVLLAVAAPEHRWTSPARSIASLPAALRFGAPLQITTLLWSANLQVDKLLIARYLSLAAVATYELGGRVAISAFTFPQLLLSAALPGAAALHARENDERLRELHDRLSRYVLTAAAVTTACLLGCADRLYAVWLGPGHAESALVMRGLAIGRALLLTAGAGSVIARAIGRTGLETWYHVIGLSLHVALALLLLPRLGLTGVLVAGAAGYLAGSMLFVTLVARARRWPVAPLLGPPHLVPALATAAGAAAALALDRVLPAATGVAGWAIVVAVSAAAALTALATTFSTRYLAWREARALLWPGSSAEG
jgi:O-antigen/teichoic acid export membrane protein